jgi:hypothetical protein
MGDLLSTRIVVSSSTSNISDPDQNALNGIAALKRNKEEKECTI